MSNYRSTASIYPQCIDSRVLRMEADFFLLTKEQTICFVHNFIEWCTALWQNDFITRWRSGDRKIGFTKLLDAIQDVGNLAIDFESAVPSEQIYNQRTVNRFIREVERYENEMHPSDASADYMNFFLTQKAQLESGSLSWKEFILSFFHEQGRICLSPAPFPELQGSIFSNAYRHNSSLFHGSVSVMISVYSAGKSVAKIADKMACFLTSQGKLYQNINGHIGVTPLTFPSESSAHMCYFGDNIYMDGTHNHAGLEPREWYPYYYLRAVEWFNIISPLAKNNIPGLAKGNAQSSTLKINELENGAIIVRVATPPDQMDVVDLFPVKHLLYDGLYPGMRELSKEVFLDAGYIAPIAKIRMQWECIPILDDEIIITSKSIVFRHKKCAYLKDEEADM